MDNKGRQVVCRNVMCVCIDLISVTVGSMPGDIVARLLGHKIIILSMWTTCSELLAVFYV